MSTEKVPQPLGEEELVERSTPNKDLASAVVVAVVAVLTLVFSFRLDVPGSFYTAPGLLPFITGFTLLLMALTLGVRAIRAGAKMSVAGLLGIPSKMIRGFLSAKNWRRPILTALVVTYVLLVAFINFELRLPTPLFVLQISSYEVISVIMVTWVLRIFWGASLLRCFLTTLITVEALAFVFRYGFGILMPETF
jgi:hypothetical protein